MLTNIIAVFLIFLFMALTAITIWAFIHLHKMGLLAGFMQGKWLLSLLSGLFIIAFIVNGIALLMQVGWALAAMRYTIYLWLLYVWLYGLTKLLNMIVILKWEKATSISQLMGRSKFFDELIEKSVEWSNQSVQTETDTPEDAYAVSDSPWEALLDDEEFFKEVFPYALRKKIKRKVIGLLVHTAIFVVILLLLH